MEDLNSRSVLVTGGGGFIGKHLVTELLREGFKVEALDKIPRPKILPSSSRLTYYQGDVNSTNSRSRSKPGTKILHLAANTPVQESVRRPLLTVRPTIAPPSRL